MNDIDERIRDAIDDLRDVLGNGAPIDQAVAEVAANYGLQPAVVRVRAEKALGDLTRVKQNQDAAKSEGARKARLRSTIARYREACRDGGAPAAATWINTEFGSDLTGDERLAALNECMEIWMQVQLGKILEENKKANAED